MDAFSLFQNDALSRLTTWLRLSPHSKPRSPLRIAFFVATTWCVLALLSWSEGYFRGPTTSQSFAWAFDTYGQLMFALPIFFLAEGQLDHEFARGMELFLGGSFLREGDKDKLRDWSIIVQQIANDWRIDLAILALGSVFSFLWLRGEFVKDNLLTWYVQGSGSTRRLTVAGWWAGLYCVPVFNYFWLRWVLKAVLWCALVWRTSRFALQLEPAHPDETGGLGFVAEIQRSFAALVFAFGCFIVGMALYKIRIQHAPSSLFSVWGPPIGFLVLAPVLFLAPLFLFSAQLLEAKRQALRYWGDLIAEHASILRQSPLQAGVDGPALVTITEDLGMMTKLQAHYERVERMRVVPFDMRSAGELVASAAGPLIPLVLEVLHLPEPVRELFRLH